MHSPMFFGFCISSYVQTKLASDAAFIHKQPAVIQSNKHVLTAQSHRSESFSFVLWGALELQYKKVDPLINLSPITHQLRLRCVTTALRARSVLRPVPLLQPASAPSGWKETRRLSSRENSRTISVATSLFLKRTYGIVAEPKLKGKQSWVLCLLGLVLPLQTSTFSDLTGVFLVQFQIETFFLYFCNNAQSRWDFISTLFLHYPLYSFWPSYSTAKYVPRPFYSFWQ